MLLEFLDPSLDVIDLLASIELVVTADCVGVAAIGGGF